MTTTLDPLSSAPLILNLGCSDRVHPGAIGVDIAPGPGVDLVADLRERWPWEDSTVDGVIAHDVFEHLPNKLFTMNELHRVLKNGAVADVIVPSALGTGAFQDPTHVSYWVERSFFYVMHNNVYRDRFAKAYGITACFDILTLKSEDTPYDGPFVRAILKAWKE